MVVKGDGSLLKADYARGRPVETVLSGPAASLSGAAFLAGETDALVADIGGTTTDIARLRGGAVQTSKDGAMVGAGALVWKPPISAPPAWAATQKWRCAREICWPGWI